MNTTIAESLARGAAALGTWITLADTAVTELAGHAGMHWVAVDLEHSTLNDHHFERHARVADLYGMACLARIPSVDKHRIKRLMDAGASGLIVANVQTRAEVDAAVDAMQYPPLGSRGVGLGRAHHYGPGFKKYLNEHSEALLIAQIEHVNALPNLDDIFSHPSLNAWMIGPYDLSASLGHPGDFEHEEVQAAVSTIHAVAARHNTAAGIHIVEPEPQQLQARLDEGYQFLAYTVDFRALDIAFRGGVHTLESYSDQRRPSLNSEDA